MFFYTKRTHRFLKHDLNFSRRCYSPDHHHLYNRDREFVKYYFIDDIRSAFLMMISLSYSLSGSFTSCVCVGVWLLSLMLSFHHGISSYRSTESQARAAVRGVCDERFPPFRPTASFALAVSQRRVLSHDQTFVHYVQWYTYPGPTSDRVRLWRKTASAVCVLSLSP